MKYITLALFAAVLIAGCDNSSETARERAALFESDSETPAVAPVNEPAEVTESVDAAPVEESLLYTGMLKNSVGARECLSGITESRFHAKGETLSSNVEEAVGTFVDCAPFAIYFTIDGKVRSGESPHDFVESRMRRLQDMMSMFTSIPALFDSLPVPARRRIIDTLAPAVAAHYGAYLHRDDVDEWLLSLDWEEDIVPLNPDWYRDPIGEAAGEYGWVNFEGKFAFDGYHEPISRTDVYMRAFWKRRGEYVFNAFQQAFTDYYAPQE